VALWFPAGIFFRSAGATNFPPPPVAVPDIRTGLKEVLPQTGSR
jgi:hypothetical protein